MPLPTRIQAAPTVPVTDRDRAVLGRVRVLGYAGARSEQRLTLWKAGDVTFESWAPYWNGVS